MPPPHGERKEHLKQFGDRTGASTQPSNVSAFPRRPTKTFSHEDNWLRAPGGPCKSHFSEGIDRPKRVVEELVRKDDLGEPVYHAVTEPTTSCHRPLTRGSSLKTRPRSTRWPHNSIVRDMPPDCRPGFVHIDRGLCLAQLVHAAVSSAGPAPMTATRMVLPPSV